MSVFNFDPIDLHSTSRRRELMGATIRRSTDGTKDGRERGGGERKGVMEDVVCASSRSR